MERCFCQYLKTNIADIRLIPLDHVTYMTVTSDLFTQKSPIPITPIITYKLCCFLKLGTNVFIILILHIANIYNYIITRVTSLLSSLNQIYHSYIYNSPGNSQLSRVARSKPLYHPTTTYPGCKSFLCIITIQLYFASSLKRQ